MMDSFKGFRTATSKLINNPADSGRKLGKTRASEDSHLSHPTRSWSAALPKDFFGHFLGHPPRPKSISDRMPLVPLPLRQINLLGHHLIPQPASNSVKSTYPKADNVANSHCTTADHYCIQPIQQQDP
ncbi:hypothetical protein Nepgr_003829 [Nepenthes gracilis]|uniref:Uncharacterized protein n=1 Tax=Nepenthes gracilis TaxID=150966 RepID=A0AAD3S090_NEPGR|nr:hypothetical protein Nepgr_003829 [Nepenthes gracilis]